MTSTGRWRKPPAGINIMVLMLARYYWQAAGRYFRAQKFAKIFTLAFLGAVFFILAAGVFLFFREIYAYVAVEEYFARALVLYTIEIFLLLTLILAMSSSLVSFLVALFRGQENDWVVTSPRYRLLPVHIYIRVFGQACWPIFIVALPAFLALRSVFGMAGNGIAAAAAAVMILAAAAVLFIGVTVLFWAWLLFRISRVVRRPFRPRLWLGAGLVVFAILAVALAWQTAVNQDLVALFRASDLERTVLDPAVIGQEFAPLPSHWAAMAVFAGLEKDAAAAAGYLFVLIAAAGAVAAVSGWSLKLFLPAWQFVREGGRQGIAGRRLFGGTRFSGRPLMSLLVKEAVIFFRQPRNILWSLFLLLVWLAQAGLNAVLGRNFAVHDLDWGNVLKIVYALEFATAMFFLSAFVLRFAFPAFSAERRTAWIFGSAPVKRQSVFFGKYIFYLLFFLSLAAGVVYANLSLLGAAAVVSGPLFAILFMSAATVITLGCALGAMFPNFTTDDPAVLSTSLSGLAFIAASLLYSAWGAVVYYRYITTEIFSGYFIFLAASAVFIGLLVYVSAEAAGKTDLVNVRS